MRLCQLPVWSSRPGHVRRGLIVYDLLLEAARLTLLLITLFALTCMQDDRQQQRLL